MALEGLEAVPGAADGVEDDIVQIDDADTALDQTVEQSEEAADIGVSVDALAGKLEEKVSSGVGATADEAEMLDIAVEHFCKRLGYKKKVIPAMEGFSTTSRSLTQTKVALENLNELSRRLNTQLAVAQEGIFDSIAKSISMIFETEDKVLAKLATASAAYDAKTPKTEPIKNPAWGKYLKSSSSTYNCAAALALLSKIQKIASSDAVKTHINELSTCLAALTKEVRGNWFTSNKADIERIETIQNKVSQEIGPLSEMVGSSEKGKAGEFEPISPADKDKMVSAIKDLLNDNSLNAVLKKCFSTSGTFTKWSQVNHNFRALGVFAEDLRKANHAAENVNVILKSVKDLISDKVKICSALVSYIEASAS